MKRLLTIFFLALTTLAVNAQNHFRDNFEGTALAPEWGFLLQPDSAKHVLCNGRLRLYGGLFQLKEHQPTTFLSIPQRDSCFQADTRLTLFDTESGDEAGLCLYRSDSCYVQAFIVNNRSDHRLRLRFQLMSHSWTLADRHIDHQQNEIWLRMSCDGRFYRFFYSFDGQKFSPLEAIETSLLSDAIARTSDKPLIGLFAFMGTTKYQAGYSFADFDYFDYQPQ